MRFTALCTLHTTRKAIKKLVNLLVKMSSLDPGCQNRSGFLLYRWLSSCHTKTDEEEEQAEAEQVSFAEKLKPLLLQLCSSGSPKAAKVAIRWVTEMKSESKNRQES